MVHRGAMAHTLCFEGIYNSPDIIKNEAEQFNAKTQ
jgi:hypothetical protein